MHSRSPVLRFIPPAAVALLLLAGGTATAQPPAPNEPGILEPVTSALQGKEIRVPNTDQSVDGSEQSLIHDGVTIEDADGALSMLGHPITHVASPNDDMRQVLFRMVRAAERNRRNDLETAAQELKDILLGTTEGRIYDGFSMLNFNRWKHPEIGPQDFPPTAVVDEYKMKVARDTGETFVSPFDGETRKIWEIDVNMLYYDGQIDSDTFFLRFPADVNGDDAVRINYRIFSMVVEDFSPTLVMLDRRQAQNTVSFPFKGFDAVWVAMNPGQVVSLAVDYPPARMLRGVYTWGWRVHPPRIQFLQPLYEIVNAHTGEVELEGQSVSYAYRNREDLTLENISDAAPEMKMYQVAQAALGGTNANTIYRWLTRRDQGPAGTWVEWADLAKEQRQLPQEAWQMLEEEGITPGTYGDFHMISVFMNNEMYGEGPYLNELTGWAQGDTFKVKLINLDKHTHYFRNVDFGTRLHDDILRCCGGGFTSFEIMNFKPSYGAPKVAEMQWRAGWGFRPHYDVIQQQGVFARGSDRAKLAPYTGGHGGTYFGYKYSEEARRGDFRFNPPPFIVGVNPFDPNPSPDVLRDSDGQPGLVIGQFTEGYGTGQVCPEDPYPGFCVTDIAQYNPTGALNFPPPPLQGQPVLPPDVGKFPDDIYPDHPVELRFPPFLRNPSQGVEGAGDIIPPTSAWETFTWINPANGTLFIDPDDPSKGYWADLTYAHGAPVFAGATRTATIELPRASGQVFYQFDDLFHDNDIFSPHPLSEGEDAADAVTGLTAAAAGGELVVIGNLSLLPSGSYASWASVYAGQAGLAGCTGTLLGTVQVNEEDGSFRFQTSASDVGEVCVQSTVGGFAATTVN